MALDLPEVDVVGQAEDAPGSVDAICRTRPDVVILDIRMPGGSGIEVLRRLKQVAPAPRVIMLTNFAYEQYRRRCEEAGADFFLDKSTEFDQIPLALEQVRRGLRAVLAQSSDPLAQAPDTPIPARVGVTPVSGQHAGARRCPKACSKETGGSQDEQGHARREQGRAQGRLEPDHAFFSLSNVQRRGPWPTKTKRR